MYSGAETRMTLGSMAPQKNSKPLIIIIIIVVVIRIKYLVLTKIESMLPQKKFTLLTTNIYFFLFLFHFFFKKNIKNPTSPQQHAVEIKLKIKKKKKKTKKTTQTQQIKI
jgi:amino acid permease